MAIEFAGWLYNNAGTAISGATVELFPRNTTTTSSESTTTSSTGYFSMTESTEGRYDVRITSGSSVRFIKYDTSMQFQEMEAHEVHFRGPDNAFTTDLVGSNVAANRVLTIPLITGSDTLATLGLAATFSAIMTHSADIIIQDASDLALGTGSDALLRWSTGDADNHSLVVALGNSNQGLHVTDVAAVATDWALAATTHPNVYIHSNTTPASDYLRLGDHDGTTAYIDVVGGTTLAFEVAGTTEMSMTASALDISGLALTNDDDDEIRMGTGGDWSLLWSDADADNHAAVIAIGDSSQALHITDYSARATDWNIAATTHPNLYIHSNTTPATDFLRLGDHDGTTAYIDVVGGTTLALEIAGNTELTVTASGLNVPANSDILFTGSTGTNDINLTDSLADALSIVRGSTDMVVFDSNTPRITITPTVTITGLLSVDDTTESTSTTTGSIHTDGGLGIVGDFYAGDDVFLTSGAVFNWNSGDVTLTHASGKLTFGGDGAVELDFNNHEMTNVDIDGGAIDGTAIGAASHSTVKGTTIDATTDFTIGDTVITDGVLTDDSGLSIAADADFGTHNVTTGGILKVDVDGSGANAAGSVTLGAGNDAGMWYDGTDLLINPRAVGSGAARVLSGLTLANAADDANSRVPMTVTNTQGVSGSATTIAATGGRGGLAMVYGHDETNAGIRFVSLILVGRTAGTVIADLDVFGSPPARSYTVAAAGDLQLAMGSGTSDINVWFLAGMNPQ